ncbi:hypothetical protein VHUM_01670 [Vanrija humicola]|uniref:Peptide hydrolase n=1 Tax=Vanrija humicola TaxID=5417 RepID=A0A7D8Z3W1_VANHU|nr:hypothetical protein VHUM_01670 [Vanrija humicola]
MRHALLLLLLLAAPLVAALGPRARRRDFRALSDAQMAAVATLPPAEWDAVDSGHLAHLLVPRVSDTAASTQVQAYLSSVFTKLGWHEDKDRFKQQTPLGEVEFTNLIYTFDVDAPRKLVLSAHFDSKWFAQGGFIGATDSSAPCATLIDVAEALTPLLKARKERIAAGTPLLSATHDEEDAAETTLQIIFFDGEEAFHEWTDTDSVYGSRHLAEKWDAEYLPPTHDFVRRRLAPRPTVLDTVDVLVLLDLLGAPRPSITSYYRETDWMFLQLAAADDKLRAAGLVEKGLKEQWFSKYFGFAGGGIDDDHRPFLHKGVPILHLITSPFPNVWHRMADNKDALDLGVLRRWNRIMRVWTAGYLGLAADDGAAGAGAGAGAGATADPTPAPRNASPRTTTDELVRP